MVQLYISMSKRSERVRYQVEHLKRNSILTRTHVYTLYIYFFYSLFVFWLALGGSTKYKKRVKIYSGYCTPKHLIICGLYKRVFSGTQPTSFSGSSLYLEKVTFSLEGPSRSLLSRGRPWEGRQWRVCTWRQGSHIGVPNQSCVSSTLSYVNTFFCSCKFAWRLDTWVHTLYTFLSLYGVEKTK